jgi:hypothetical protein
MLAAPTSTVLSKSAIEALIAAAVQPITSEIARLDTKIDGIAPLEGMRASGSAGAAGASAPCCSSRWYQKHPHWQEDSGCNRAC